MTPLALMSQPLALLPSAASALLEECRQRLLHGAPPASLLVGQESDFPVMRPYQLIGGVAIIPVHGALYHGEDTWWCETYEGIAGKIALALADEECRGVLLHVDSPGGMVSGCFDFCDALYGLRGGDKPVWSLVDEAAYSAAYAIVSSTDRILLPRTAGVGSIGVITMHVDVTKAMENFGVKVTTIQFGERKSDSYPTTPLSEEARQRMQSDVDYMGEMFVEMVARNRGIKVDAVRDTQAGCFLGEEGVRIKLADAVMPAEQALAEFIEHVNK